MSSKNSLTYLVNIIIVAIFCVGTANCVQCDADKQDKLIAAINKVLKQTIKKSDNYGAGDKSITIDVRKSTVTPEQLAPPTSSEKTYTIECPEKETAFVITASDPDGDLIKFDIQAKLNPNKFGQAVRRDVRKQVEQKLVDAKKNSNPPSVEAAQAFAASMSELYQVHDGKAGKGELSLSTCIRTLKIAFDQAKPVVTECFTAGATGKECESVPKITPDKYGAMVSSALAAGKYVWLKDGFNAALEKFQSLTKDFQLS